MGGGVPIRGESVLGSEERPPTGNRHDPLPGKGFRARNAFVAEAPRAPPAGRRGAGPVAGPGDADGSGEPNVEGPVPPSPVPMPRALLEDEPLDRVAEAAKRWDLCDHCLGRLVWRVESGMGNPARAEVVRDELGLDEVPLADCWLCKGIFRDADLFADVAGDALEGWEFETYLVGTRVADPIEEREQEVWEELGLEDTESVSSELNRIVGKQVGARFEAEVDFGDPDVAAVVDTRFADVDVEAKPLFLFGRYRKLEREIPQTRWPCSECRGSGCEACDGSGKQYPTSVEELVAEAVVEVVEAREESFHGAGREDVDALMLGTGRPFVLELNQPRVRSADAGDLEERVNEAAGGRVEVEGLRWTVRDEVPYLKEHSGAKTYRLEVVFETPVEEETLKGVVRGLVGPVDQRTPTRVSHRRADKVRSRRVLDAEVVEAAGERAVLRVAGEAGLYVKELVSGDEGRTEPSLARGLGVPAEVEALDVEAVDYTPPPDLDLDGEGAG